MKSTIVSNNTSASRNTSTARRGYVTYQALKEKHGKRIADRIREEKHKQQEEMNAAGSTEPPVAKPSSDLPDCEEWWSGVNHVYIVETAALVHWNVLVVFPLRSWRNFWFILRRLSKLAKARNRPEV